MIKYEVTYEVKPSKGKRKTIKRDFFDESIAKSEVTFVKEVHMSCGVVTATDYKKVKK